MSYRRKWNMEKISNDKIKIISTICILVSLTSSLSSLEFYTHENNSKTLNAIMAIGEIKHNDAEKLDRYLSKLPYKKNTAIYFDSPGGNLYDGMRLGEYFKKHRIKTVIQGYKICASACALAFLGGTDRNGNKWMSSTTTSKLGFHAFSNADGTKYANSDNTQKAVADILTYGEYVGASMKIFIKQFSTPSNDIYWFSTQEELNFGIKVWDIENERFIQDSYSIQKAQPSYSHKSTTSFIREYFGKLKQVSYFQTWNMLSSSMKRKANLTQYTKWWKGQVDRIILESAREVNKNTVQTKLKYYLKNGKVYCSQDTFTLQKNGQSWLIDNQRSKTISCR